MTYSEAAVQFTETLIVMLIVTLFLVIAFGFRPKYSLAPSGIAPVETNE